MTTRDLLSDEYFSGTPQPTLCSGRLRLRPWSPDDAPAVFDAFRDPAIQRWHTRTAATVGEVRAWIESWTRAWRTAEHANWAVTDADTGDLLGRASLRDLQLPLGRAEAAYWTTPAARGRGVATRALGVLTGWALAERGFQRVELRHSVENPASCRVAAKGGFRWEGTLRGAGLHADGWHDMHLHARLRGDR